MRWTKVCDEPHITDNEDTSRKYPLCSFTLESLPSAMDENNWPEYMEAINIDVFWGLDLDNDMDNRLGVPCVGWCQVLCIGFFAAYNLCKQAVNCKESEGNSWNEPLQKETY